MIGRDPAVSVSAGQRVGRGVDRPEELARPAHRARPAYVAPHGRGHRHLLRGELGRTRVASMASVTDKGGAVRPGRRSRGRSGRRSREARRPVLAGIRHQSLPPLLGPKHLTEYFSKNRTMECEIGLFEQKIAGNINLSKLSSSRSHSRSNSRSRSRSRHGQVTTHHTISK